MDKEIIDCFRDEAFPLLKELECIVEKLEEQSDQFPTQLMLEFSQKIDRIMGTAKTVALDDREHLGPARIGQLSEICKILGQQAAAAKKSELLPIFAAFWADTIEAIREFLEKLEDKKACQVLASKYSSVLTKRLEWLSKTVGKGLDPNQLHSMLKSMSLS